MSVAVEVGAWQPAPALAERPAFAIGDVHGRFDLLSALLHEITLIIERDKLEHALIITLGDYIDRGPQSLSVLKLLFGGGFRHPCAELISLPGNHEQLLWSFLHSSGALRPDRLHRWLSNDADSVAREVGISVADAIGNPDTFAATLRKSIGVGPLKMLSRAPNHMRLGKYLFVHGGLHPDIGLHMLEHDWRSSLDDDRMGDRDPLWIRGPFLTYDGLHEDGIIVVHGHTPRDEPELRRNRLNVDTRAFASGRLTAVQLARDRLRIVQAVGDTGKHGKWF